MSTTALRGWRTSRTRPNSSSAAASTRWARIFSANIGTVNVARDLDAIRAALGDDKLTYLGYSYGTRIGSAYAEAFPQKVRAMILDGAVDPNADPIEADLRQAKGFQDAFNDYATDCAKQSTCPLGTDPTKAIDVYHSLVDPMVDPNNLMVGRPVHTNDPRGLSYSDAIVGTIMALYTPTLWHHLTDGLSELVNHHGDTLLALADMYMRRDPNGHYTNATDARVAINCVDQPPITDRAKVIDEDSRSREIAPFMSYGQFTGDAPLGTCAFWPVPATSKPHAVSAPGLAPTVVVSTTHDPATPYKAGVDLANPASRLAADLRRHPTHRGLPGRQLCRRLRDGVSDRRHHAAQRREVLAVSPRAHATPGPRPRRDLFAPSRVFEAATMTPMPRLKPLSLALLSLGLLLAGQSGVAVPNAACNAGARCRPEPKPGSATGCRAGEMGQLQPIPQRQQRQSPPHNAPPCRSRSITTIPVGRRPSWR